MSRVMTDEEREQHIDMLTDLIINSPNMKDKHEAEKTRKSLIKSRSQHQIKLMEKRKGLRK